MFDLLGGCGFVVRESRVQVIGEEREEAKLVVCVRAGCGERKCVLGLI